MMQNGQLATPVLLLTFNRPDTTAQVIAAVREARPTHLFIASDGPRPHVAADHDKVCATRELLEAGVDWPCVVTRRYADENQGCRAGVSTTISWFFEHVEAGIILEDDCVPHPDFFPYCEELLHRYRDDGRVMSIGGDNSAALDLTDPQASYTFARQPLIWGWATWRRAWAHYDDELAGWRALRSDPRAQRALWPDRVERRWQVKTLDRLLRSNKPDTWDYHWSFSVQNTGGLSVVPAVNLIRNVGFGVDGTHTQDPGNHRANAPISSILPLTHPATVERDLGVERQIFDRVHGGAVRRNPLRRIRGLATKVRRRVAERWPSRESGPAH